MEEMDTEDDTFSQRVLTQFKNEGGEIIGAPMDIPIDTTSDKLELIINAIQANEDKVPFSFYIEDHQIKSSLKQSIVSLGNKFEDDERYFRNNILHV